MGTVRATITELPNAGEGEAYKVVWANMAGTDDGEPVEMRGYNDRSVQATGNFDSGTMTWQGSNDGTNYAGLRDPSHTALTLTAAGLKGILEATHKQRPLMSGGGGSCSVTVTMICTRAKR